MHSAGGDFNLRILEQAEEMEQVEQLQRAVWPGDETEIVPAHLLLTAAQNGGLVIGAFARSEVRGVPGKLAGFVFGFPGFTGSGVHLKLKHCSHMLGVLPELRDQGIGFALKRAQWQMVRSQGLELVTWTYDPLLSRNAYLNIARLGAVCSTYKRNIYGDMRDGLNSGLPSDRFQVDWWVNSQRVNRRLSRKVRSPLDLAHFLSAGAVILNPTRLGPEDLPWPGVDFDASLAALNGEDTPLLLLEIPADFQALRAADLKLALDWRLHSRGWFEGLFSLGYIATDFIFLAGATPRSFYVLIDGDQTL